MAWSSERIKTELPPVFDDNPVQVALRDADRLTGLGITVHDLSGVFSVGEGTTVLDGRRQSHRRFAVCRLGYCSNCLKHCNDEIMARCATEDQPFVHECWKGVAEVVAPLVREGVPLAVIFAGQWKSRRVRPDKSLSQRWRKTYDKLDRLDPAEAARIGHFMQTFGLGLLQHVEAVVVPGGADNRRAQVMRFLHFNVQRDVHLEDLARVLHLSSSRTSHLVKELFDVPFQELVILQRMFRARHFLRTTDLLVAEIGRRVGIDNEYYFNRLFKRTYGLPPATYRRKLRQGKLPPDV